MSENIIALAEKLARSADQLRQQSEATLAYLDEREVAHKAALRNIELAVALARTAAESTSNSGRK